MIKYYCGLVLYRMLQRRSVYRDAIEKGVMRNFRFKNQNGLQPEAATRFILRSKNARIS